MNYLKECRMEKYHKYVFDLDNRKFVGDFEEMYKNESSENFDSWHQDDMRQLQRQINLSLLQNYNFNLILDIGCGKGAYTQYLKKKNNTVFGIDISPTAVNIASERYPDISFFDADIADVSVLKDIFKKTNTVSKLDLIFCAEVFSYIYNWEEVIAELANHTTYFLTTLFIPENPIGFVKTSDKFVSVIENNFEIIEIIKLEKTRFTTVFAKRR